MPQRPCCLPQHHREDQSFKDTDGLWETIQTASVCCSGSGLYFFSYEKQQNSLPWAHWPLTADSRRSRRLPSSTIEKLYSEAISCLETTVDVQRAQEGLTVDDQDTRRPQYIGCVGSQSCWWHSHTTSVVIHCRDFAAAPKAGDDPNTAF